MLRAAQIETESETYWYDGPGLSYELEHCLLFGKGSSGQLVIRHQELFAREWHTWRDTILPKFLDAFPGRRPAAAYISGELPLRPVLADMPLTHPARDLRSVYVIADDNTGFWYRDWPEPYQQAEPRWLRQLEAIDAAEFRAAAGRSRRQGLRQYRWEHGARKK